MRKKTFSILIIAVIIAGTYSVISKNSYRSINANASSAKLSFYAESLDELIGASQYIIIAEVSGRQKDYNHMGVKFVNTEITIEKVLKGDSLSENQQITLLQTAIEEDPIVKRNKKVLLFIDKYEGPVTEDAYVCQGLYQGHYILDEKKILPTLNFGSELNKEIENLDGVEDLFNRINKLKI
jgi:hypothetical protein